MTQAFVILLILLIVIGMYKKMGYAVTNSQSSLKDFRVSIENETPKLDVLARCYEDGEKPGGEFFAISPGWIAGFDILIDHGRTNTFSCDLKLGKKHGTFRMFDLKNTSICHNFGEKCHWNVREDGACLLMKVVVVVAAVVVAVTVAVVVAGAGADAAAAAGGTGGAGGAGAGAGAVVVVVVVVAVAVVVVAVVVIVVVIAIVAQNMNNKEMRNLLKANLVEEDEIIAAVISQLNMVAHIKE
ncbi:hypothetical protein T459_07945 [Capsicum annuum]|uniref:S-protein homolog n=1 Tax=Capsicum annuum TaxID=4072 RepID=A0A2G2ZV34_CAPAN|nr:hypothetical protein T459_07945 [Capsicum annuum]